MKNEPIALPPFIKEMVNAQSPHEQLDLTRNLKTNSHRHNRSKDPRSVSVRIRSYGSLRVIPGTTWMNLRLKGYQHYYGYDGTDAPHINHCKKSFPVRPSARSHRDLRTGGNYGD
jgi:hypothetical protein